MRSLILVSVLMLLLPASGAGGSSGAQAQPGPGNPRQPAEMPDEIVSKMTEQQRKKFNQKRYAEIRRDTDKLLELANQLKRYVDNANENVVSLEVIRKAEEIEKLARDVKSRMKSY